ncbi:KAP family P-loop NTPase fold protein [Methylotenera mobilis]|uniref:KAP family P-loop NTPase fold protein n=1 Tax=Methylotenera mobilis TaxID=359408 RepID=UPI00037B0BD8|nr:P-loop NTPase fold protein [Methylotenera mobilis]PPC96075.1 MAG: hypothetical protein CTY32_06830 [Methylotenera sp.]
MNKDKNTWNDDKLDRQKEAEFIISYLTAIYNESLEDISSKSFVLSLDAPWGYGKSYFLKKLKEDLEDKDHPVLYFDAWENDYSKDPLLGFISEIEQTLNTYKSKIPQGDKIVESFLKQGKRILATATGIGVNILAKKLTGYGLESIKEQFSASSNDALTEAKDSIDKKSEEFVSEIIQKSLDDHKEFKTLVSELKLTLEKITSSLHDNANYSLPMFILVDELDRCRPTYAIELLEVIKHIFNAKGIFFILATNKEQLAHSIKAIYGDSFDSYNYLKRFFNQEYTFSIPSKTKYVAELFSKYRINKENLFIPIDGKINNTEHIEQFLFEKLSSAFELGLRDMEQICIQLKSIMLTYKHNIHYVYLLYILMIGFKNQNSDQIDLNEFNKLIVICQSRIDHWHHEPREVPFHSIINFYQQCAAVSKQAANKLYNDHLETYQEAILNSLTSEKIDYNELFSIAHYNLISKQAGHIS